MALQGLEKNGDPDIRRLAPFALAVREAVKNESAAPLENALKASALLPMTSFYSSVIDDAARIVLEKAFSMPSGKDGRADLISKGVALAAVAASSGFFLSERTSELLKKARKEEKSIAGLADLVLRRNEAQTPQPPDKGAFKDAQKAKPRARKGKREAKS